MRKVEKRKFSCFYDTQLPTVCRLPFAVNVMLNLSIINIRIKECPSSGVRLILLFHERTLDTRWKRTNPIKPTRIVVLLHLVNS